MTTQELRNATLFAIATEILYGKTFGAKMRAATVAKERGAQGHASEWAKHHILALVKRSGDS